MAVQDQDQKTDKQKKQEFQRNFQVFSSQSDSNSDQTNPQSATKKGQRIKILEPGGKKEEAVPQITVYDQKQTGQNEPSQVKVDRTLADFKREEKTPPEKAVPEAPVQERKTEKTPQLRVERGVSEPQVAEKPSFSPTPSPPSEPSSDEPPAPILKPEPSSPMPPPGQPESQAPVSESKPGKVPQLKVKKEKPGSQTAEKPTFYSASTPPAPTPSVPPTSSPPSPPPTGKPPAAPPGKPPAGLPGKPPKRSILSRVSLPKGKKILKILIVVLLLVGVVGGGYYLYSKGIFDFGKDDEDGEVTLTYWGLWESEGIMEGIIQDWEKDHPNIKVEYIRQRKEQYRERLQSQLGKDEGPDVFRFHNTWLPMFKDELSPLPSELMSAAMFEEIYYPVVVSDLRKGAQIYGLPLGIDTLALFYNREIFRAARKEPPETWYELREVASELTVRDESGQVKIAGIAMGVTDNIDHWSDILGLMMLQNGVDLTDPKGKLAKDALLFFSYIYTRDKSWSTVLPNSTRAFAGGNLAMYFGFSWDVFEINRMNKDLDYEIIPVPQLPEREEVAWASYWVEGVSKRSQYQKEAWQFLNYLTSPEVMRKIYQAASNTRAFGPLYARKEMAEEIKSDPLVAPFIEQAPYAKSWYFCSRTFDNGLNKAMIDYLANAVNGLAEGKAIDGVLSTLNSGIDQVLAQYKISR